MTDRTLLTRDIILFTLIQEQPFISDMTEPFETKPYQSFMFPLPFPILTPSVFFVKFLSGKVFIQYFPYDFSNRFRVLRRESICLLLSFAFSREMIAKLFMEELKLGVLKNLTLFLLNKVLNLVFFG